MSDQTSRHWHKLWVEVTQLTFNTYLLEYLLELCHSCKKGDSSSVSCNQMHGTCTNAWYMVHGTSDIFCYSIASCLKCYKAFVTLDLDWVLLAEMNFSSLLHKASHSTLFSSYGLLNMYLFMSMGKKNVHCSHIINEQQRRMGDSW